MIKPIITEKSVAMAAENKFMFNVDKSATKYDIKSLVESEHGVTVKSITTLVRNGKKRSSYRKGKRPLVGSQSDRKIAYVTVEEGQRIKAFDDIIEGLKEEAA